MIVLRVATRVCECCGRRDARQRVRDVEGRPLCARHAARVARANRVALRRAYGVATRGRWPAGALREMAEDRDALRRAWAEEATL